jgi:hypothetical protein
MIDAARAEPVLIEKFGRGAVMVISVEKYKRLSARPERTSRTLPTLRGLRAVASKAFAREQTTDAFNKNEAAFLPRASQLWQFNRIPFSPLHPRTRFLRWMHTDSEENYNRRGNRAFSVESVGYEFNSLGYRGPEFVREPGGALVLFLGDSNTFGLGVPWNALWTTLVTARLEECWGMAVRQCNLAWGGTGSDFVAMMLHQTVDVLKPDAVFILWSFVPRMTWFADPRRQVHFIPEWKPNNDMQEHAAYLRLATEAQGFYNYVRNFHLVNARLAHLRIPYVWGNMEPFSRELLRSYVPLEGFVGHFMTVDGDLARDARHAGLQSHALFATHVLNAVDRLGVLPVTRGERAITPVPPPSPPPSLLSPRPPSLLKDITDLVTRSTQRLVGDIRLRRRVRAMKRRDPFIY